MALNTLEDAFVHELGDVLNAEKQIARVLPKMAKAATDPKLKESLARHQRETEEQIKRVERVFEALGKRPRGPKCEGMKGILEEGANMLNEDVAPEVLDALIIAGSQKAEHYEIATYGTLCTWADQLGLGDASKLLKQTLSEEKKADELLTDAAMSINQEAAAPSGMA
ncbi:MAG: ferritin-like domain-containing protein [Planctomycetota bacterium]